MQQSLQPVQTAFQYLMAKLFPQEVYYIGGPDPLPEPLSVEEEQQLTARLAQGDDEPVPG